MAPIPAKDSVSIHTGSAYTCRGLGELWAFSVEIIQKLIRDARPLWEAAVSVARPTGGRYSGFVGSVLEWLWAFLANENHKPGSRPPELGFSNHEFALIQLTRGTPQGMVIFSMRIRLSPWLATFAVFTSQMACVRPAPRVKVYRLGQKVGAGPLIYEVSEAKWLNQIGEGLQARTPSNRFLIIHLTVVNNGAETVPVQPFTMTDESGRIYNESMEGPDVANWLGMIRNLKPADTLEGNIVFDVEPTSYKLKLDDGSESGDVLLVELPLQFGSQKPTMPDPINTLAK